MQLIGLVQTVLCDMLDHRPCMVTEAIWAALNMLLVHGIIITIDKHMYQANSSAYFSCYLQYNPK